MIDLYRPRRGYNYRCLYWKRDVSGAMDNEELIHNSSPSGVFYAKIASGNSNDAQDVAGVFRFGTEGVSIETQDVINVDKDDIIQFDGATWIAGRVVREQIQKNAEFGRHTSNITTIELNKGR